MPDSRVVHGIMMRCARNRADASE